MRLVHPAATLASVLVAGCTESPVGSAGKTTFPGMFEPPFAITDTTRVVTDPVIDVLIAIDPDVDLVVRFGDQVQHIVDYLSWVAVDWRIGVVSTALGGEHAGVLVAQVDADTEDPVGALRSAVLPSTGPRGALGATWIALSPGANPAFLRDDSALHVVTVTASDDTTPPSLVTEPEWREWFDGLRPQEDRTMSALVPAGSSALGDLAMSYGGVVADSEAVDLRDACDAVGVLVSSLERTYFLTSFPDPETIVLEVHDDGDRIPFPAGAYLYDPVQNAVIFLNYVPSPGAEVAVRYTPAL